MFDLDKYNMCKYFQHQTDFVINLNSVKLNKFIDYSFRSQIPSHIICNCAHLGPNMEVTNVLNYVFCSFVQKNANQETSCCSNYIMNSMKVFIFLHTFHWSYFSNFLIFTKPFLNSLMILATIASWCLLIICSLSFWFLKVKWANSISNMHLESSLIDTSFEKHCVKGLHVVHVVIWNFIWLLKIVV